MIYGREVTLSTVDRDLSNVWQIESARQGTSSAQVRVGEDSTVNDYTHVFE